jgi:hypothetical protein
MKALIWKCLIGATALLAFSAQAVPVDCPTSPTNYVGLVSGASACQYDTEVSQDFNHDPLTVNTQGFFGASDWSVITHGQNQSGTSGSWALDPANWGNFAEIMLVFKGGNANSGSFLVSFLLETDVSSGTWESPFKSPLFDFRNPRDLSHISYYGRGEGVSVPESSPLALMLLGLLGLGFARRKTRQ